MGPLGKRDASIHVHGGCELPFYLSTDLQVIWKEYHVISQIAHLGQDNAGHCRTILHTAPTQVGQRSILALLTDDWTRAERISKIPYWFSSNTICFWLCRADQLDLYRLASDPARLWDTGTRGSFKSGPSYVCHTVVCCMKKKNKEHERILAPFARPS